jgi:Ca2+-binding EF-hand superfamily protein
MMGDHRTVHVNLGAFLRDQCGSLKEAFNLLDLRSTGQIKQEDFVAGLKRLGYQGAATEIFEEMDTKSAGCISVRDFIVYFTNRSDNGPRSAGLQADVQQDDTGSTGMPSQFNLESSIGILREDAEARLRQTIELVQQGFKDQLEEVRQEVAGMQTQHQSEHLSVLQAIQTRPLGSDIEKLTKCEVERHLSNVGVVVKNEVERSVHEVEKLLRNEIERSVQDVCVQLQSQFGDVVKDEVARTIVGVNKQLEGQISGINMHLENQITSQIETALSDRPQADVQSNVVLQTTLEKMSADFAALDARLASLESAIPSKIESGATMFDPAPVDERLASLETVMIERIQSTLACALEAKFETAELRYAAGLEAKFETEALKLDTRLTASESAVKEVSLLIQTTLLTEFESKLSAQVAKLTDRLNETETTIMELADDEALQKRCIPFFQDKLEAPIVAQEGLAIATEAREGLEVLQRHLEKLQDNFSVAEQKHEEFAEQVMGGIQGLMSSVDDKAAVADEPSLHPSPDNRTRGKAASYVSLPGLAEAGIPVCEAVPALSQSLKSMARSPSLGSTSSLLIETVTATPVPTPPPAYRVPPVPAGLGSVGSGLTESALRVASSAAGSYEARTAKSTVHGAIQALRQDLLNQNISYGSRAASPEKAPVAGTDDAADETTSPNRQGMGVMIKLAQQTQLNRSSTVPQLPTTQAEQQQLSFLRPRVGSPSPPPRVRQASPSGATGATSTSGTGMIARAATAFEGVGQRRSSPAPPASNLSPSLLGRSLTPPRPGIGQANSIQEGTKTTLVQQGGLSWQVNHTAAAATIGERGHIAPAASAAGLQRVPSQAGLPSSSAQNHLPSWVAAPGQMYPNGQSHMMPRNYTPPKRALQTIAHQGWVGLDPQPPTR